MTSYLVYVYDMRLDLVDLDVLDNMTRQKMFFFNLDLEIRTVRAYHLD